MNQILMLLAGIDWTKLSKGQEEGICDAIRHVRMAQEFGNGKFNPKCVSLMQAGSRILAIKEYRESQNVTLIEAIREVHEYMNNHQIKDNYTGLVPTKK